MGERVENILDKALEEKPLSREELELLLSLGEGDGKEALFKAAREMRSLKGGDLIYSYGFVYLSTICRNDCLFCAYRRSNPNSLRYRKTREEVVEASLSLAGQGVNLIDLTMGEDPDTDEWSYLLGAASLISEVREAAKVPVMISPGLVSREALGLFKNAGALFYACYQETHSPELFRTLRLGQSYEKRWNIKKEAKSLGLLVEDGVLCGVGESPADLAHSILSMKELGAEQVRAMAFVPYDAEVKGKIPKKKGNGLGAPILSESSDFRGLSSQVPIVDNPSQINQANEPKLAKEPGVANKPKRPEEPLGPDLPFQLARDQKPELPAEEADPSENQPDKLARERELTVTAVLRLSFPKALIPASLDVEGLRGLRPRLDAGANLITSFVPGSLGLAGVAQSGLDIENERRSVPASLPILKSLGLRMATPDQYLEKVRELS
jgi:biotin synthase-like enzyme